MKILAPQSTSIKSLRIFLEGLEKADTTTTKDLIKATGFTARRVAYCRVAAKVLDLTGPDSRLTDIGLAILATPKESDAERALLYRAMEDSAHISKYTTDILGSHPPDKKQLGQQIAEHTGLSPSTAKDRATTIISWRRYILAEPKPPTLRKTKKTKRKPKKTKSKLPEESGRKRSSKASTKEHGSPTTTKAIKSLFLPTTYESVRDILSKDEAQYHRRLSQFVQPVEDTEHQVAEILSRLGDSTGRLVVLFGPTGSGKSTFSESLTWRKHLGFKELIGIDCSDFPADEVMKALTVRLQDECARIRKHGRRTAISIDYLESLEGHSTRSFFQTLNGLLRKTPAVIIWPVTTAEDATTLHQSASSVSGTLFDQETPLLHFNGPKPEHYPAIATNAIAVFNQGNLLQEFLLTPAELDRLRDELVENPGVGGVPTIRDYLYKVKTHWSKESGHLKDILKKLPRPNEVWVIFCHTKAEVLVGQFANKGKHAASAWKAFHAKLWDYIPNTKREARWPTPARLQQAIEGALTTRILHTSPQSIISTFLAYGKDGLTHGIQDADLPNGWRKKGAARRHMRTTALYRQLVGDEPGRGQTPGGPAARARMQAEVPFAKLNKYLTGNGRDRHVNHAVAELLSDILPPSFTVTPESPHPWIPSVVPDIRVDTPDGRQINLEFCYTNKQDDVWRVPDYVLDKLSSYMDGLDIYTTGR